MRILTWNVNGLRAVATSKRGGLRELLDSTQADIICLQETKLRRPELTAEVALSEGWESFFDFSVHKTGYSGVATFCKAWCAPCAAQRGLVGPSASHVAHLAADEIEALDQEGRCIMTDHGAFVLFNVYIPALSCEDKAEVRCSRSAVALPAVRRSYADAAERIDNCIAVAHVMFPTVHGTQLQIRHNSRIGMFELSRCGRRSVLCRSDLHTRCVCYAA